MSKEERPRDDQYYDAYRTRLLSQGDIFKGLPVSVDGYSRQITQVEDGSIRLLSGPVQAGFAMLTTPTCAMSSQDSSRDYDHDVRSLVPLLSIAGLLTQGLLSSDQLREAKRFDGLINYMYLPPHSASAMPESLALLFLSIPIGHALLTETATRVTQLAIEGARQLHRKLVWYESGVQHDRKWFQPPMD